MVRTGLRLSSGLNRLQVPSSLTSRWKLVPQSGLQWMNLRLLLYLATVSGQVPIEQRRAWVFV